ncbi:hypothetical protein TWF132_005464 [Orbilia oligospora]|nr:hypothetical protein TWF132_005464 [Orbilia oligospora]
MGLMSQQAAVTEGSAPMERNGLIEFKIAKKVASGAGGESNGGAQERLFVKPPPFYVIIAPQHAAKSQSNDAAVPASPLKQGIR